MGSIQSRETVKAHHEAALIAGADHETACAEVGRALSLPPEAVHEVVRDLLPEDDECHSLTA